MSFTYSKLEYMCNITFIGAFPCIYKKIIPEGHWAKFALIACWKSNQAPPTFEGLVPKVVLKDLNLSIGAKSILVTK
jgi:hypothetical protein